MFIAVCMLLCRSHFEVGVSASFAFCVCSPPQKAKLAETAPKWLQAHTNSNGDGQTWNEMTREPFSQLYFTWRTHFRERSFPLHLPARASYSNWNSANSAPSKQSGCEVGTRQPEFAIFLIQWFFFLHSTDYTHFRTQTADRWHIAR